MVIETVVKNGSQQVRSYSGQQPQRAKYKQVKPHSTVVSTAVQLNLFQFFEPPYGTATQTGDYSVKLNQQFRQQAFREPMRLLRALPRLHVMERRLYWLVLGALKSYQFTQQASASSLPLLEQRLAFQFHRSRLRVNTDGKAVHISVSEIKQTLKRLAGRTIEWENSKGDMVAVHMFDTQYLNGEGLMVLELNPKLTEAFLKLGNDFAQNTLEKAMQLQSEYSQVLYSFLSRYRWRGKWQISLDEFLQLMNVNTQKGYNRFFNIVQRIIKPAMDEINELGDMSIDFTSVKENRQVTHLSFTIGSAASPARTSPEDTTASDRLANILSEIKTMSLAEKVSFAANTMQSYYANFNPNQQEQILTQPHLLEAFIKADAYVEAGMVSRDKHEAYVGTSVFGRTTAINRVSR